MLLLTLIYSSLHFIYVFGISAFTAEKWPRWMTGFSVGGIFLGGEGGNFVLFL